MKNDGHDRSKVKLFSHKSVTYMMTSSNDDFIWGAVVIQQVDNMVKCRRGRPRKISIEEITRLD